MPAELPYLRWYEGDPYITVPLNDAEMQELMFLIDDEPVDEELLSTLRKKLKKGRKNLRQALNKIERTGNGDAPEATG